MIRMLKQMLDRKRVRVNDMMMRDQEDRRTRSLAFPFQTTNTGTSDPYVDEPLLSPMRPVIS